MKLKLTALLKICPHRHLRTYFLCVQVLIYTCFMITMTGCSNSKEEPTVSKGRYIESEMNCSGSVSEISDFFVEDGKISFLDLYGEIVYKETENKNMFNASRTLKTDVLYSDISIINSAVSQDGSIFFDYYNSENTSGRSYGLVLKDGQAQNVKFDESFLFVSYVYGNNGTLYSVDCNGTLYEINVIAQNVTKLYDLKTTEEEGTLYKLDCVGDYIVMTSVNKIVFFDCRSSSLIDTPQRIEDFWNKYITEDSVFDICDGEEDSFYIACENGLFRYVMNGALVEQLIDGYSCHLGNPSYKIKSVIRDNDTFIISYSGGNFFRYNYDAEAINEITSTLKIYSLEKNDTLAQLINEYHTQFPSVRIDYEVGLHSGMTIDDAIKNLTTEILSDNAPDVIMLDGLDIDNLCENNVLLDLSEYENIWNPNDNLLDNVAKWNEKDGLYSVACKFRIPAVAANKETLENLNSFTELADQSEFWRKKYNDEHPIIYFEKPETVIRLGLMYCGTSILDENNLDRNALESFFDNCSRLYNNDQHSVYYRGYSSESNYPNVNDENLFAMRLGCCFGTEHAIAVGTINTFMLDLNIAESIENSQNKYDVDYKFGITDEIRSFVPNCNLAIVQSDSNKTDAINFIALALNTNIQKINLNDGFPVNTETLNWFYEKNKNINDTVSYATCDAQNNTIETFIVEWMDDDEASEFDSYIKSLDEPIIIDNITRSIIEDIGNRCINGDITPGEAADEVIKKIKLKGKE